MKTRSESSKKYSLLAALLAAIPVLGWAASAVLILVALIQSIAAIAANEKGCVGALINALFAIPVSVAIAIGAIYMIGG